MGHTSGNDSLVRPLRGHRLWGARGLGAHLERSGSVARLRATSEAEVDLYVTSFLKSGFEVASRSESRVILVRHKRFSPAWLVLGLVVIYLAVYLTQTDQVVEITIG